jgi:hypothetical protein
MSRDCFTALLDDAFSKLQRRPKFSNDHAAPCKRTVHRFVDDEHKTPWIEPGLHLKIMPEAPRRRTAGLALRRGGTFL